MRFSGQGLMSHTSATAITRFFDKSRGKALSTIWFGLSSAEFILPVLVTYLFLIYSWRTVWQGITLFSSGFLVDKFTSRKLIPLMNIPLLFAMTVLFFFQNEIYAYFFLGLIGVSNGLANVLGSSTWAEIYGVKYIGSIRALTVALMVFATAFGTALFGILIDYGFTIESIAFVSGAYIVISWILLIIFRNRLEPIKL